MEDPDSAAPAVSTDTISPEQSHWKAYAAQAGRPGIVVSQTDDCRDLYCFDPAQPIITGRPADWLGFGGRPFSVATADGQVVVTNNLAHLGQIPPEFHPSFPPDAVVTMLPPGDTYEVAYSGDAHNLRKVMTGPGASLMTAARMSSGSDPVDVVQVGRDDARTVIAQFADGKPLPPGTHADHRPQTGGSRQTAPATARTKLAAREFPAPPAIASPRPPVQARGRRGSGILRRPAAPKLGPGH